MWAPENYGSPFLSGDHAGSPLRNTYKQKAPKTHLSTGLRGASYKPMTHGSTQRFHSYSTVWVSRRVVHDRCARGSSHHPFPLLTPPFGLRVPSCRAYALYLFYLACFLRRLYSERGFMISRQSRSPRSSAMISTSAVAMLVATGMLYRSHIRSSSCSVSS